MYDIMILLPERLDILRSLKSSDIPIDREEYSVYFKNIIYPYSDEYDIVVDCPYGRNYGNCWRLDSFPDESTFEMAVKVYAPYGKLLAQKSTTVHLYDKKSYDNITLLCIGDSMTRSEVYISQAANKMPNVTTVGTRAIRLNVNHEGRGGWKSSDYLAEYYDRGKGVSPFLFPVNCSGEEYFGDKVFFERLESDEYKNGYFYCGSRAEKIADGMYCVDEGKLYKYENGNYTLTDENPQFEFSFGKYLERNGIAPPDIVSLLFGANDVQLTAYEDAEKAVEEFISNMRKIVSAIKSAHSRVKLVVSMPVCGAEQYAWGKQLGCRGSAKRYEYLIKLVGRAILKEFDQRRDENIYVCPMLAVCDPEFGFAKETVTANLYSESLVGHQNNWVHPNEAGYKQMGDALAGTLAAVRNIQEK